MAKYGKSALSPSMLGAVQKVREDLPQDALSRLERETEFVELVHNANVLCKVALAWLWTSMAFGTLFALIGLFG